MLLSRIYYEKTIPQQICTPMFRTDTPVAQHAHTVSSERLTPVGRNLHGVANYLNNHGYTKKLRQNGTIPGFSSSFIKKIIDNPVYMGKIAYGRRRTEKKTGTRNETHVVEQSEFPVYEGIHEAIISEEDWSLAQEKRSKNNYRREKIHNPEHAHILSGILKCPCCGKGMYGNIAKAGRKDNKTRYYYYCKNTVNATGHKCTFRCNIEQSQIDDVLAKLITAMTKEGKFKEAIQDKIGSTVDTTDLEKQLSVLNAKQGRPEPSLHTSCQTGAIPGVCAQIQA